MQGSGKVGLGVHDAFTRLISEVIKVDQEKIIEVGK